MFLGLCRTGYYYELTSVGQGVEQVSGCVLTDTYNHLGQAAGQILAPPLFCWCSKVFLDKSITNRTIGRSLRVDFPKSKQTNTINKQKKRTGKTLFYWGPSCTAGDRDDLLANVNSWIWIQRGSMRTTVPSTR